MIDVHCHLEMLKDIEGVIDRSKKAGVNVIITQGVNVETNRTALKLAGKYKEIKAALGMYPSEGIKLNENELKKEIDFIRKNKNNVLAIGEVGLDLKELGSLDEQEKVFERFVNLSIELGKPIIVHSRKAEKECIEVLEKLKAKKVIMHCFSGNFNLVKRIADNGWFLTIPTSVKNSEHFQKIMREVDLKQLLCETDSPYLHPDKNFPNEPGNVIESYKKIAEIKGISLKEAEKKIEENYNKLFD